MRAVIPITCVLVALLCYAHASALGFPDGHLTDFERAEKPLVYFLSGISVAFAIVFAVRPKRALVWAFLVLLGCVGLTATVLRLTLDDGRGG